MEFVEGLKNGEIVVGEQHARAVRLIGEAAERCLPILVDRAWHVVDTTAELVTTDEPVLLLGGPGWPRGQQPGLETGPIIAMPLSPTRPRRVRGRVPVATGCARGPAPSDASALARSIQSDPDLQVTAPVGVSVGGVEGLAMDITVVPGASVCEVIPSTQVLTQNDSHTGPVPPGVNLDQGSHIRLYLIDLPEGSATRILAIAVVAPEARFDDVIEAAAPIIESIEFHAEGR